MAMADTGDTYRPRERSRSPNRRGRSRSPNNRRSYSPRDRSRSRRRRSSRSPMTAQGASGGGPGSGYGNTHPRSYEDRAAHREQMMNSIRETSQQDRRVYVGNLSYDVKWHHLKDFMRQAGEVLYADVLLLPNGMSKGCGIVEYANREQAQTAVATLSNQNLMGRLVYVREDREAEPRYGPRHSQTRTIRAPPEVSNHLQHQLQLYVTNLPFTVGWQDLKDYFRPYARTGGVIRADVHTNYDGRPKGSGTVLFENPEDARYAMGAVNGREWQGRRLEVREDRYPTRGKGGHQSGPQPGSTSAKPFTEYATSGSDKSETIYVRNLPWSTSNEDLVELFITIGTVEHAEIQYEPSGRSRGTGVVKFDSADTAETAITKFQGYSYGERPLGLSFVKYINPLGGHSMDTVPLGGSTQDLSM